MYYIYILQNENREIYIGYTPDLKGRIAQHRKGRVYSTKHWRSRELIYYEAYKAKSDAIKRERALKLHKKALAQLKLRIGDSLSLIGGGQGVTAHQGNDG